MDPLSPSNINGGWSSPPSAPAPLRPPTPDPATPTTGGSFATRTASTASPSLVSPGFEREPKVFGAPGMGLLSSPSDARGNGQREAPRAFLRVRIGTLERNRKDLLVRFDASTNLPNFRTGIYKNIQRSYVEFQRFAEQVQLVCPQTIIPALPLPSTSALTDEEDDRLVRIALQQWFSRICDDPVLRKEDELRVFIESDFGYSPIPPPSARRQQSSTVFSALTKVVRRGPLDEDDDLQSAKLALERLEERYAHSASLINQVGKVQRQLAVSQTEVGARWIGLSTVESEGSLGVVERKLGRAWEGQAALMAAQAATENIIMSDSLGYQSLNARAAKDTLVRRTLVLEDSQAATKNAINKRRNLERLKASSSINPAKVDDAIAEMQESDATEQTLTRRVSLISENLHVSLRTHSRHAHEDIAISLLETARLRVGYHKQQLRELESLKNDVAKVVPGAGVATVGGFGNHKVSSSSGPALGDVAPPPPAKPVYSGQPAYQPPLTPQGFGQGPIQTRQPTAQPQPRPAPFFPTQAQPPFHPDPPPSTSASGSQSMYTPVPVGAYQPPVNPQPAAVASHGHPQLSPAASPAIPGAPSNPPPSGPPYPTGGTQSMFLPPGPGPSQRPRSAAPHPGAAAGPGPGMGIDPLGGGGAFHPRAGPNQGFHQGMTQSMYVPSAYPHTPGQVFPSHPSQPGFAAQGFPSSSQPGTPGPGMPGFQGQGQGPQRSATVGRKRLDERKAAKLLAGGF